jgi:hypothetical protein
MNTSTSKSEYILLFRGSEWYKGLNHEQLQKIMGEFKGWFDRLAEQGKVKGGQPLGRSGAIVSGKNGRSVSDGPFAESKEAIGGYLVLQADTLEEAIAVAKSSPGLAYGASIEVRPIAEECPINACARQMEKEEQLAHA